MGNLRHKVVVVADRKVVLESIGVLSDTLGMSSRLIRELEDNGVLPPATMIDDSGRRWYSRKHIGMLKEVSSNGGFAANNDFCWKLYAHMRESGEI